MSIVPVKTLLRYTKKDDIDIKIYNQFCESLSDPRRGQDDVCLLKVHPGHHQTDSMYSEARTKQFYFFARLHPDLNGEELVLAAHKCGISHLVTSCLLGRELKARDKDLRPHLLRLKGEPSMNQHVRTQCGIFFKPSNIKEDFANCLQMISQTEIANKKAILLKGQLDCKPSPTRRSRRGAGDTAKRGWFPASPPR